MADRADPAASPDQRVRAAVASLRQDASTAPFVADVRTVPARPARLQPVPEAADLAIGRYLLHRGIPALYAHQAQALQLGMGGHDLILATATASGKTLSFGLPVLHALSRDPDATALFLYPLKALTHDQLEVLLAMERTAGVDLSPAVYDGAPGASCPTPTRCTRRCPTTTCGGASGRTCGSW